MQQLSANQLASFNSNGFLVVRNVVPEPPRESLLRTLIRLLAKYLPERRLGIASWEDGDMHDALRHLRQVAPRRFGLLYDTLQGCLAVQGVSCNPSIASIAASLLHDSPDGLTTSGVQFRMDPPADERNRLDWHQDNTYYPQNDCGDHGLVAWVPLFDLAAEHGPLVVLPGSHRLGTVAQVSHDPGRPAGTTQQMRVPSAVVERFPHETVSMAAGDAGFFHMDLVHRGGHNQSSRVRFAALARYHRMLTDDFHPGRFFYQLSVSS